MKINIAKVFEGWWNFQNKPLTLFCKVSLNNIFHSINLLQNLMLFIFVSDYLLYRVELIHLLLQLWLLWRSEKSAVKWTVYKPLQVQVRWPVSTLLNFNSRLFFLWFLIFFAVLNFTSTMSALGKWDWCIYEVSISVEKQI